MGGEHESSDTLVTSRAQAREQTRNDNNKNKNKKNNDNNNDTLVTRGRRTGNTREEHESRDVLANSKAQVG